MVFLDFDGTVSGRDVVDALLERYAAARWLEIEGDWQAGRIGSRECLRDQIALVRATPAEVTALLASIDIDPGFVPLIETCTRWRIPLHIVSDGFDYCIDRILLLRLPPPMRRLLRATRICASHLEPDGDGRWKATFPFYKHVCHHGCATCKAAAMRVLRREGDVTVFVGDGLSDRYATEAADIVFAKQRLATFCRESNIPYRNYEDLSAVAEFLEQAMRARRPWRLLEGTQARA
jgi:2-hydroxy-3-keto-5-methylthiopentenyl-1-phosphate phosphatase